MSHIVTIGKLSVETFDTGGRAPRIAIGDVSLTLTPLMGRLLFEQLTPIREALVTAHAVLVDIHEIEDNVTAAEATLSTLLVELGITPPPPAKEKW